MDIVKVTQICAVISIRATVIGREWLKIVTEHADPALDPDLFLVVFALYTLRAIIETANEVSEFFKPHDEPQFAATTAEAENAMTATDIDAPLAELSMDK